jgi:hypothetical protein
MTARKTRKPRTVVTTEDAFGTPPAARGSMMKVAGKTDADEDLPLLTDDGEAMGPTEGDDTTMKGPVYPEGRVIRIRMRELRRLVRSGLI